MRLLESDAEMQNGAENRVRMRRVEENEACTESVTDNGDVIGCERLGSGRR